MTYQIAFIDRDRSYALRCKEGLEEKTRGLLKIHFFINWKQVRDLKEFFHPDLIVADHPPGEEELPGLSLWPLYLLVDPEDDPVLPDKPGPDQVVTCLWTPRPGRGPGEIYRYQDLTGLQEALFLALSFQARKAKVEDINEVSLFLTPFRDFPLSSLVQSYCAYRAGLGEKIFYWNRDPFSDMPTVSKGGSWSTLYLALLSQKMNLSLRVKMAETVDSRGFSYFPPPRSPGDGWKLEDRDLKPVLSCLGSDYDRVVVDWPGQAFLYDEEVFTGGQAHLCLPGKISPGRLEGLMEDYLRIQQRPNFLFLGKEGREGKMESARRKGFRAAWINPFEKKKDDFWKEVENDLYGGAPLLRNRG